MFPYSTDSVARATTFPALVNYVRLRHNFAALRAMLDIVWTGQLSVAPMARNPNCMTRTAFPADRFQPIDSLSDNFSAVMRAASLPRQTDPQETQAFGAITQVLGLGVRRAEILPVRREREKKAVSPALAASLPATLTIVDGPGRDQTFDVTQPATAIGRGADQNIQLDFGDAYVSRSEHAVILFDNRMNHLVVRDGAKANPVYLNGGAIRGERQLYFGDRLTLGQTTLLVSAPRSVS